MCDFDEGRKTRQVYNGPVWLILSLHFFQSTNTFWEKDLGLKKYLGTTFFGQKNIWLEQF